MPLEEIVEDGRTDGDHKGVTIVDLEYLVLR